MAVNRRFKAVIFDMDGLLVDSETVWAVAEKELVAELGYTLTDEIRNQIIGLRIDEYLSKLRDLFGMRQTVAELTDLLLERVLKLIPTEVRPQLGAREIVHYVHDNGIPHAIASSSPMTIINATLESQGWNNLFVVRCSADDDAYGKPAPDVYLRAARTLGVDPKACLALEDSPNGARAAVAAGMTCYAVPDTSHSGFEAFVGITPHVFADLNDVLFKLNSDRSVI